MGFKEGILIKIIKCITGRYSQKISQSNLVLITQKNHSFKCTQVTPFILDGKSSNLSNLTPALLVTNLVLVFKMGNNFCFARQRPDKTSSVRSRNSSRRSNFDGRLMNVFSGFINEAHEQPYEAVHYVLVLIYIADFEGVIEKDVSCKKRVGLG